MKKHPNQAIVIWLLLGIAAYILLPWYAIQDTAWYSVLPQIFGGSDTANGWLQAWAHGRIWLLLGLLGLGIAAIGLFVPVGKAQGAWFIAGGGLGFFGLALSGFLIGARGWQFEALNARFGELAVNQYGIGIGALVVLAALLLIAAFGFARRGFLKAIYSSPLPCWVARCYCLPSLLSPFLKPCMARF